MTGADLIEALEKTGTGQKKLEIAREKLREKLSATAEEVILHMELRGAPEGTLFKARALVSGSARVDDFLGKPPITAEDTKLAKLGDIIAKKTGEAFAEQIWQAQEARTANPGAHKPRRGRPRHAEKIIEDEPEEQPEEQEAALGPQVME